MSSDISTHVVSVPSQSDYKLYIGFLAFLVLLPLPLGSGLPWAHYLFDTICFAYFIWWQILFINNKVRVSKGLKQGLFPVACMLAFCIVTFIQLIPLPSHIVEFLRPDFTRLKPAGPATITIDPYATWVRLRLYFSFTTVCFLTLALINSKERLRTLATVVVVGGILQGVCGSLMNLSGVELGVFSKKMIYLGAATGTFLDPIHFTSYLVLCLALGAGLMLSGLNHTASGSWREHGRRLLSSILGGKFCLSIGLAMMVFALLLTGSRLANISFFFSLAVAGSMWLRLSKRLTRGNIFILLGLVVTGIFLVSLQPDKSALIEPQGIPTESTIPVSFETWQLIKAQPLLGFGAGGYETAYSLSRQGATESSVNSVPNDLLKFLAEHGVLGLLPLFALMVTGFFNAIEVMRSRKTLVFSALALAPIIAITTNMLYCLAGFNLQIPGNIATFLMIVTLSWVLRYTPAKQGLKRRRAQVL